MALAALISLALALPALRVRGEYFVAASLGLQMLAITVFTEWKSVTGGIGGLTNIPPARLFGVAVTQPEHFLLLSLICLALIILVIRALVRSSFGRSLKAIRDDETAAWAYGKNVAVIKTTAVVVSSALVIIGGTATLFGPVIGSVLILLLPAALSYLPYLPVTEIGSIQQIVYGLAMVVLMIYRPGGLWGFQDAPRGPKSGTT
jgi:branched-chain amino acid transport system permease protein